MEKSNKKQIILSGIQPTGIFTLGNFIGAIQNWVELQKEYQCAYMIADLHALTVRQDPVKLKNQIKSAFAVLLSCGVNPHDSLIFIQSHVAQHTQLAWILSCHTQFGELSRMTQFKDKSSKYSQNINAGLFTYPSLQAADILLYQANFVPIGSDQKQHLELTRDIANRFNSIYGNVFTLPEPYFPKLGGKIMSLAQPEKKMSKSDDNPNGYVSILDSPDVIMRKFKRAVTDSGMEVSYREHMGKEGINNLMIIYSTLTKESLSNIEQKFAGKGYGVFKKAVGEVVIESLRPIQENYKKIIADSSYLEHIYIDGAKKASFLAQKTLEKVYKKVGFIPQ